MDTDKLQQTNSFIKGMNIDFADGYLDDEQYRFARNLRLTADKKSNSGELNLIEGVTKYNVTYKNRPIDCTEVLATASIRDYGIIVTKTEKEPKNSYWIYIRPSGKNIIVSYPEDKNGSTSVCQAEITLKFTIQVKDSVSGALKNSAVVINIPEGTLTTKAENSYKVSDHEIHALYGPYICTADDYENKYDFVFDPIVDLYYRVTANEVNATWCIYRFNNNDGIATRVFGPCIEPLWNQDGNYKLSMVTRWESDQNVKLYIADGVHSLMIVNIMKNNGIDFANISTKENIMLTQPVVEEILLHQGNLNYAVVQYAYKLYNQYGISTNISPLSKPELMYTIDNSGYVSGIPTGDSSSAALRIKIKPPVSEFERIKVYRIGYVQKGQAPEIHTILDEPLVESDPEFSFVDNGTSKYEAVLAEEFSVDAGVRIIPKTIESKNDYLFAANVNYVQDELFNDWDATSNIKCTAVRHEQGIVLDKENAQSKVATGIKVYTNQDYITYNKDCQTPSLRRGEWYRYGIVLYDEYGNRSQVKWIGDVRYEGLNDIVSYKTGGLFYDIKDNSYEIKAHPVGVKFEITGRLPEGCSGYEIVRCERTVQDSYTITQGILGCTIKHVNEESELYGQYSASPVLSTDRFYHGFLGDGYDDDGNMKINVYAENSSYDLLSFVSPEISYQSDDIEDILNAGQKYYINPLMSYCSIKTLSHEQGPDYVIYGENSVRHTVKYRTESILGNLKYMVYQAGDVAGFNKILGAGPYHYEYFGGEWDAAYDRDNAFGQMISVSSNNSFTHPYYNKSFIPNNSDNSGISDSDYDYTAYIKLRPYKSQVEDLMSIDSAKIPESYQWNELFSNDEKHSVNIGTKQISLGDRTYDNCSIGTLMNQLGSEYGSVRPIDKMTTSNFDSYDSYDTYKVRGAFAQLIGPSGRQLIIRPSSVSESFKTQFDEQYGQEKIVPPFRCMLCNIQKKTNAKYGGDSDLQKRSNIYYSRGNFYNSDVTEGVVYDGDTYIQLYEHVHLHKWFDSEKTHGSKQTVIYAIPLESSINLAVAHGARYSSQRLNRSSVNYGWIQDKSCNISAKVKVTGETSDVEDKDVTMNYTQEQPMYQYNTAYSGVYNALIYAAQQDSNLQQGKFDSRVHYSNHKLNNEIIDSWQTFAPANFLDVDTRFGEITGLRLFKDKLIYWQENATGMLSVNERSLITDASNAELVLGTGDVLSRYDYITTSYGMKKDQYCDAQSKDRLYWWDYHKKDLCALEGGQCVSLSDTKNVRSYTDSSTLNENPVLTYDSDNNELLACVCKDESLVYSEQVEGFTGVYELKPTDYIKFNNSLLLLDGKDIFKYNTSVDKKAYGFKNSLTPSIEFIVNKYTMHNKVFDNQIINMTFDDKDHIRFTYKTPLNQEGSVIGDKMRDFECNYKLAIPRHKNSEYGDRLRGKTMSCTISSTSNSTDFSIQSVLTKFRISL